MVKYFTGRCFAFVVHCHTNVDTCSQNHSKVIKAEYGKQVTDKLNTKSLRIVTLHNSIEFGVKMKTAIKCKLIKR